MAERLEPLVVVLRSSDIAFIRSQFADLPPLEESLAMRLNGWTEESLIFGRLLGALCDSIRSGDLELEARRG